MKTPLYGIKGNDICLMSTIEIYTDGSSLGNGKKNAMAGVGVYFGKDDPRNVSEKLLGSEQTNNRAELTAILSAIKILNKDFKKYQLYKSIIIYSDSKYSIDCVTKWYKTWEKNSWKTKNKKEVKNQDIIKDILEEIKFYEHNLQFKYIKAHTGLSDKHSICNQYADELAVLGAKKN